jgi:CheY-like chemotaxis protein
MNPSNDSQRPILLVEDNPLDIDLTLRAFKKQHFVNPIEVARDGEEAVGWVDRCAQGHPLPLLVLLDLKLPRIDGPRGVAALQGARRLQADTRGRLDQFL